MLRKKKKVRRSEVYFFLYERKKRGKKVRPLLSRWDDSLLPAHSPLCVPLQCSCIHLSTLKSLFVKEKKAEVRVVVSVESESSSSSSNNNKHDLAFLRSCQREREKFLPKKKKNNNSITIRARRLRTSIIHSGV